MESWGKSIISVSVPIGGKLSEIVSQKSISGGLEEEVTKEEPTHEKRVSRARKIKKYNDSTSFNLRAQQALQRALPVSLHYRFKIFRANISMDLIKKLLPDEASKAAQKDTETDWSSFAENYKETDFKNATKHFNVSEDSTEAMKILQNFHYYVSYLSEAETKYDFAHMLTSPQHYDKGNNQFWRNMFEYVYEQTAEKAAAMDDDSFGL